MIQPGPCPLLCRGLKLPGLDRVCTPDGGTTGGSAPTPAGGARRLCGPPVTRHYLCSHRAIRETHSPPSARQSCLGLSNPASAAEELSPHWLGLGFWAYLINTQTQLSGQCLHSPFPASAPASSCSPGHKALLSLNRESQVTSSAPARPARGVNEEPSLGAAEGRFLHSPSPASRTHVVRFLAAAPAPSR